jgi:glycosyltransferase involved in cell wall biosynthesis
MSGLRISIVTPSFNQGDFIERTFRSVLLQNYRDLEYIVMDGGSSDQTREILEKYRDHFAHCASEKDKGQADAIARGLARSSGEVMAYLNSDDILLPGTLHWVNDFFLRHPWVDAIYSHRLAINEDDRATWYWILPVHLNYLMRRWDFIPQETCFWRRRLFDRAGNIDDSYRFAMDYDLFVRYMKIGKFRRVNRFLAAFRVHSESKTSSLLETVGLSEIKRVWNKHKIRSRSCDPFLRSWFGRLPSEEGLRFARLRTQLPGSFPGLGYDLNEVWGGLLRRPTKAADHRR